MNILQKVHSTPVQALEDGSLNKMENSQKLSDRMSAKLRMSNVFLQYASEQAYLKPLMMWKEFSHLTWVGWILKPLIMPSKR